MATYLVMKNNLRRVFTIKFTYLVMVLIPVAVSFISVASNAASSADIRVGIICEEDEFEEIAENLGSYMGIQCERADASTKHTDVITGKYQYLIDAKEDTESEVMDAIGEIVNISRMKETDGLKSNTGTERKFALLLTAYMMIASLYASRMIRDKKIGTVERYCLAGYKKSKYSFGYMASTGIVILCQLSLAVGIMSIWDKSFIVSAGEAVEMILFMAVVASAFGVVVASILKSELHANILASSTIAILSLLGGTFVPVEQMPEALQFLSVISPIRWLQMIL